jgi:hypothetical protein
MECCMVSDEALLIMQERSLRARDLRTELLRSLGMLSIIDVEKTQGPSEEENASLAEQEVKINKSIHKALWDFCRDDEAVSELQQIHRRTPSLQER